MAEQTTLELGLPEPPLSPYKVEFVEAMFAGWLATADGNTRPTEEHKRRARTAAEAALRALA